MNYPRNVLDWYRDATLALEQCTRDAERISQSGAPIVRDDLVEAVRLSKQLVALIEHEAP